MSIIAKWALQAVALFLFGWMATVAANWSSTIVSGSGNDRLAQLNVGNPMHAKHVAAQDAVFATQEE